MKRELKKFIVHLHGINALWYITHINNLDSILRNGILSRDNIRKNAVEIEDISDISIQRRRWEYHKYVPLFFADNTPMLYRVIEEYGVDIILLEVNEEIILKRGVMFSDGNIAATGTNIFSSIGDLKCLDKEILFSRYGAYSPEWKRKRSAEVLIPNKIGKEYIRVIHVQNRSIQGKVRRIIKKHGLSIEVKVDLSREGVNVYG